MRLGDILDILSDECGDMQFGKVMQMARNIMELHAVGVREANSNGYNEGYKSGHEVGKSLVTSPSPDQVTFHKYERVYSASVKRAEEIVGDIVRRVGQDKKVACIKELRTATGLGIADSKRIVDDYCLRLDNMYSGTAYYGDEPPF